MLTEKTQLNCLKILNNPDDHLTVSFSPKKCHVNINNYFVLAPEAVSKLVSLTLQILKIMNTPVCPYPPPLLMTLSNANFSSKYYFSSRRVMISEGSQGKQAY